MFLYNWRTQRSESERSALETEQTDDNRRSSGCKQRGNAGDEESVDESLSDAPNECVDDHRYAVSSSSNMFNTCKDATNLLTTPPIKRPSSLMMKKKPKKISQSPAALKLQLQRQLVEGVNENKEPANGVLPVVGG